MNDYHKDILTTSLDARIREVTEYQVNIDNFTRAIAMVGDDAELQPFKENLEALLASSKLEQRKAQIMLDVIRAQLEENP